MAGTVLTAALLAGGAGAGVHPSAAWANAGMEKAPKIGFGSKVAGVLETGDFTPFGSDANGEFAYLGDYVVYHDYHKFTTSADVSDYTVSLKNTGGAMSLCFDIYDADYHLAATGTYQVLGATYHAVVKSGDTWSSTFKLKKKSVYYVDVFESTYSKTLERSTGYELAVSQGSSSGAKVSVGAARLSSVTPGAKKLTAKWKKVSAATGYQVRLKKGSGSWKKSKTTKLAKVFKGLAKGARYSVCVRAYKVSNGKTYYGKWSKTISKQVK